MIAALVSGGVYLYLDELQTFAKAARTRRDNLATSIRDLKQQKDAAEAELIDAENELQKAERLEVREARGDDSAHAGDHRKAMIG